MRLLLITLLSLGWAGLANAEPYFAVQTGLKCMACHVNPTGGGMRNTFGQIWGQTQLPEKRVDTGEPWTGELNRFFAVGGNVRASGTYTDIPNQRTLSAFDVDEARVYLDVRAIPDRLSIYVDQRFAPGGSSNAEAYARLSFANQRYYVKAGQLFLPFGIRLQDDTAFAPGHGHQLRDARSRCRSGIREHVLDCATGHHQWHCRRTGNTGWQAVQPARRTCAADVARRRERQPE